MDQDSDKEHDIHCEIKSYNLKFLKKLLVKYGIRGLFDRRSYVCVDPAFRLMRFPLDGELEFYLKNYDFYLLRK